MKSKGKKIVTFVGLFQRIDIIGRFSKLQIINSQLIDVYINDI